MSEANRDDAMKCLDIARAARAEGNLTKAKKFAEKAKALYPCAEVDGFLRSVQGGTSSSYQAPSAPNTRQRTAAGASATPSNGTAAPQAAASTPAQREMVKRIRASRGDFYKVLGVERDASDADIKKAYKKLALKVHPDRCSAPGSEEAFKEVSKAFQCLTDPHKRAYYDRTGHEDRASASAAAAASRGGGGGGGYGGGGYQDLDPEQLFNMMFGGGGLRGFGMGPMHFGGFPQGHPRRGAQQRRQQQQHTGGAQEEQAPGFAGLLPILIAVALLLVTLMSQQYSPSASIARSAAHPTELFTAQRSVPFYVKDEAQFERSFPARSPNRYRLERQLEAEFQNELLQLCRAEFARENRARTSVNFGGKGNKARFESAPKPNCERLYTMFGTNTAHHGW